MRKTGNRQCATGIRRTFEQNSQVQRSFRLQREYHHHLSIGRGSLLELETQVLLCRSFGYLEGSRAEVLLREIEQISKMLGSLMAKLR